MGNNLPEHNVPDRGHPVTGINGDSSADGDGSASAARPAAPVLSKRAERLGAGHQFVLVVADDDGEDGDEEDAVIEDAYFPQPWELDEDEPGQPGEVVARGLELPDGALVYLRNPLTGRSTLSSFGSAERARRFYSRAGALHLVYV